MEIKGLEGLSSDEIRNEIAQGGKFVIFTYCFSIILMTFRRPTDIYFIRANESPIKYGWPWLLISFFFGWWGIPWGPIYTIQAIVRSFSGKDVTAEVILGMQSQQGTQYAGANPATDLVDNLNKQQSN